MYNYKKYKDEKIFFYKPKVFFKNYKKIDIKYNKNNKIIIQTPKMKIPFNLSDRNICIAFDEKSEIFYNFIKYLDNIIKKLIKLKKNIWFNKLEYKSILSKYKDIDFMTINMPLINNQYIFDIYNDKLKKININTLQKNDDIVLIIQLEYLWLNNDKIGCHWNVLQIKKYEQLNFNKCLIVDENILAPPPLAPPPLAPPLINPINEKYLKMLKMGIPVLAVKNNMIRDGKDTTIINSLPDNKEDFIKSLNKPIKSKEKKLIPSTSDLLNMKNVLKKAKPMEKIKKKNNGNGFAPSLDDITNMRNVLKKIDRNIPKKVFNTRFGLAPTVDEIRDVLKKIKKKS